VAEQARSGAGASFSSVVVSPFELSVLPSDLLERRSVTSIEDSSDQPAVSRLAALPALAEWAPPGPVMLAPLPAAGHVEGVLILAWRPKALRQFHAVDVRLVTQFARQAGLTLQLARVRAERDWCVALEERDRIGRHLHDTVIQRLFALGLSLETVERMVVKEPEVATRLTAALVDLDAALAEIRRTILVWSVERTTSRCREGEWQALNSHSQP
jgi:signal transduction histidine kinase